MTIVRNIGVTAQSEVSFDDACRVAVPRRRKPCVELCCSVSMNRNVWWSMIASSPIV